MNFSRKLSITLYLIRHADPERIAGTFTPPTANLSKIGERQAQRLSMLLKEIKFSHLYNSSLPRAKQTAKIVIENQQLLQRSKDLSWLNEIDLGVFGGKKDNFLRSEYPKLYTNGLEPRIKGPLVTRLLLNNREFVFPNGESLKAFYNRVSIGLEALLKENLFREGETVGLVAHAGSLSVVLQLLLGYSFEDINYPVFIFEKANILKLSIESGRVIIHTTNPF